MSVTLTPPNDRTKYSFFDVFTAEYSRARLASLSVSGCIKLQSLTFLAPNNPVLPL